MNFFGTCTYARVKNSMSEAKVSNAIFNENFRKFEIVIVFFDTGIALSKDEEM